MTKKKDFINPFALINDKDTNKFKLILDKKLYEVKSLCFLAMQNTSSIEILTEDFKKFIGYIGKIPDIVDFISIKKSVDIAAAKKLQRKKEAQKRLKMQEEEYFSFSCFLLTFIEKKRKM